MRDVQHSSEAQTGTNQVNPVRSVYTFPAQGADPVAHYGPCQDRGNGINVATSAGRG